jgi:predicted nucleic-acid-binding Zn-ribbon protein
MAEVGRTLHESLFGQKLAAGKCKNCDYSLEVYGIDFKKNRKILKCQRCGLYHYYKKDIVGKWRLQKVAKPDSQE